MNSSQENKVSMYYKIITFFNTHLATLGIIVANLLVKVPAFVAKVGVLASHDQEATENITGYSIQKNIFRELMRDKLLAVAGPLRSWALDNNDNATAQKASVTKSSLDNSRDTDALFISEHLYGIANSNALALADYGASAAKITALENAIADFRNYIQQPTDQRAESASARRMVEQDIVEIDQMLKVIDGMMEATAEEEPMLYQQYKYDRLIDDNTSGGGTDPDIITTLNPESYTSVLNIPYLESRSFTAKNLSVNPLQWGLSTETESFSNPPHDLEAGAVSTKLSITLAPDGDNLVFYNPNPTPADIEITIFE